MRRVLAVAFFVVLLVEWGSHNLAFAHSANGDGRAVQSQQDDHEDPCKNLVRCSDGPQREQSAPRFGHDVLPYNPFSSAPMVTRRWADLYADPRLRRSRIYGLFRPADPLFHPPKLS